MKNKKNVWIISSIIAIVLIAGIVYLFVGKTYLFLEANEISDMETSTEKIPEFTIVVKGLYEGSITNLDLEEKGIQVYEFNAGVDNGWTVNTNHYTGVKLLDVLKAMDIDDYSAIEFTSPGELRTKFAKDEISEKTFLTFYRDGEVIREDGNVNLLSLDFDYRYSLEHVITMDFK